MDPLSALSSLHVGNIGNVGNLSVLTPTTPAMPGAPVTEGFSNLLAPAQSAPASAPIDMSLSPGSGESSPTTWGHMVQQMVMNVNDQQATAAAKVNDVLAGGPTPVHEAMIASETASLSFEFLAQARNKIVDAYQQVMQMQV